MNTNKQIFNTIIEIIILTLFIIFTNKVWDNLSINKSISTTYLNEKNLIPINYNIENNIKYLNNNYNENEYIKFNIYNESDIDKDYTIYLIIDNNTNIDDIKIMINNEEKYITDLEYLTLNNEIYYIIEENTIQNNNSKEEKLYIWNNNDNYKDISFKLDLL